MKALSSFVLAFFFFSGTLNAQQQKDESYKDGTDNQSEYYIFTFHTYSLLPLQISCPSAATHQNW